MTDNTIVKGRFCPLCNPDENPVKVGRLRRLPWTYTESAPHDVVRCLTCRTIYKLTRGNQRLMLMRRDDGLPPTGGTR